MNEACLFDLELLLDYCTCPQQQPPLHRRRRAAARSARRTGCHILTHCVYSRAHSNFPETWKLLQFDSGYLLLCGLG